MIQKRGKAKTVYMYRKTRRTLRAVMKPAKSLSNVSKGPKANLEEKRALYLLLNGGARLHNLPAPAYEGFEGSGTFSIFLTCPQTGVQTRDLAKKGFDQNRLIVVGYSGVSDRGGTSHRERDG